MDNFEFSLPTKIYFGKGVHKNAAKTLKAAGAKRVLLHYGGQAIKRMGLYDELKASIKAENITCLELGGVVPNPRLSLVYKGIELCREQGVDFVLAAGGGSVIDSAKAICLGSGYSGDVWDFFATGKQIEHTPLGLCTVLTIPAAGSETSTNTVITKDEGLLKRGFGSPKLRPKFSFLNPEFCYTLPPEQTANGVSDILAHLMERYFTNTQNVELTDNMLEAVMRTVIEFGPKALANPKNYEVWAQIMWAGSIAHNGILDTGRIGDWASHGIEHELSALYEIAHGAGLAVVFPAWMKYVYKHDVNRFARFAREVFSVSGQDAEKAALTGIRALTDFYKKMNLPTRTGQIGAREQDFALMAQKAAGDGTRGNFVALNKTDIEKIYYLAADND